MKIFRRYSDIQKFYFIYLPVRYPKGNQVLFGVIIAADYSWIQYLSSYVQTTEELIKVNN